MDEKTRSKVFEDYCNAVRRLVAAGFDLHREDLLVLLVADLRDRVNDLESRIESLELKARRSD